jgi:hypothetical protein
MMTHAKTLLMVACLLALTADGFGGVIRDDLSTGLWQPRLALPSCDSVAWQRSPEGVGGVDQTAPAKPDLSLACERPPDDGTATDLEFTDPAPIAWDWRGTSAIVSQTPPVTAWYDDLVSGAAGLVSSGGVMLSPDQFTNPAGGFANSPLSVLVPEPQTLALLAVGLLTLGRRRRR